MLFGVMSLEIMFLRLLLQFPGVNELVIIWIIAKYQYEIER